MSQEQAKQFIVQGIAAAKAGDKDQARQLFQSAIKLSPENETAWLWLSSVARDNRERLFCFQNLLQINPENEMALKGVQALGVDPAKLLERIQQQSQPTAAQATSASAPTGDVPIITQETLTPVMDSIEKLLQNYTPVPMEISGTEWDRKEGGRYGESLAARQRNIRIAGLAAAAVFVLLFCVMIALFALGGGDEGQQVAANATLTPSFTPSNTPTATPGVTNTPSPEPAQTEAPTVIPNNLRQGSIYGNPPTEISPPLQNRERSFADAVALYSAGDYEAAIPALEAELEQANQNTAQTVCPSDTYFYTIAALAESGTRRNVDDALALAENAAQRDICSESPMIFAANCLANYEQYELTGDTNFIAFNGALGWCQAAIDEASRGQTPILAYTLYGDILTISGDYQNAASALDEILEREPDDVNLLLARARVEIGRDNLDNALVYIGRALYVEPLSKDALSLRVNAFLDLAAQTSDPAERVQQYGTAVIWTQEYLIRYPGDPIAFTLLAKARLGEGNVNLALDALNRVIENNIQGFDDAILEAYQLRSQIYVDQSRYDAALLDAQRILQDLPEDLETIKLQADLAYITEDYSLALEGYNTILEQTPDDIRIQLQIWELLSETCRFTDEIDCDDTLIIEGITDDVVANIEDEAQQALALGYRAKALYHQTQDTPEGDLTPNEIAIAYDNALTDIETALAANQTALNHYYRALVLEGLNDIEEAIKGYQWITYWAEFYEYPFIDDVTERLEALVEDTEDT